MAYKRLREIEKFGERKKSLWTDMANLCGGDRNWLVPKLKNRGGLSIGSGVISSGFRLSATS